MLTEDSRAIDTRHLGFTMSPHEECGVEEAVRIIEANKGDSVVLTLGPPEAAEQLRDAMALEMRRDGDVFLAEGPEMRKKIIAAGAPADRTIIQPISIDVAFQAEAH